MVGLKLKLKCVLVIMITMVIVYGVINMKHSGHFPVNSRIKKVIPETVSFSKTTETAITTTTTTTQLPSLVNIFHLNVESPMVRGFAISQKCVDFKAPGVGTVICVHPVHSDLYVSGSLVRSGMWEVDLIQHMSDALKKYPDMELLDLGCNIGVYTIYAAKLGRRVIGVDANKINLALLDRALGLNKLQRNVTLIWNAISDVHESVVLTDVPENNGGRHVKKANVNDTKKHDTIQTITLDDIATLFVNSTLFIKMDIEGCEYKALKRASALFKLANVRFVMMEMLLTRNNFAGRGIYKLMTSFGFKPFSIDQYGAKSAFNAKNVATWPENVIWIK